MIKTAKHVNGTTWIVLGLTAEEIEILRDPTKVLEIDCRDLRVPLLLTMFGGKDDQEILDQLRAAGTIGPDDKEITDNNVRH